jgi:hypothetical protein
MGVRLIGVANKMQLLQCSWTLPNDSKHNEACFMTISTDSLRLRVAQTPGSRDLAIFVLTTDRQTDCFTPCCACMHTRGNKSPMLNIELSWATFEWRFVL